MPRIAAALAVLLTVAFCIGFNTIRYPVVWEMIAEPDPFAQSGEPAESEAVPETSAFSESGASWQSETADESNPIPPASTAWSTPSWCSPDDDSSSSDVADPVSSDSAAEESRTSSSWSDRAPFVAAISAPDGPIPARETPSYNNAHLPPPDDWADTTDMNDSTQTFSTQTWTQPTQTGYRFEDQSIEATSTTRYAPNSIETVPPDRPGSGSPQGFLPQKPLVPVTQPYQTNDGSKATGADAWANSGTAPGEFDADTAICRLPPVDEVWPSPYGVDAPPLADYQIPAYPSTGVE